VDVWRDRRVGRAIGRNNTISSTAFNASLKVRVYSNRGLSNSAVIMSNVKPGSSALRQMMPFMCIGPENRPVP